MIKSFERGHEIYFDGKVWRYKDNNKKINGRRACKKCGAFPTKEGFDACLGFVAGKKSVCCGHGVCKQIIML